MSRRRRRVPGTFRRDERAVVLDLSHYVAPRVGTVPADGRAVRRALCGHDVYLGERGLDAVGRRRKRLYCGECRAALATEHGLRLGVLPAEPAAAFTTPPPAAGGTT
jgi:hypothetical protein